jgi:hypothetical protein
MAKLARREPPEAALRESKRARQEAIDRDPELGEPISCQRIDIELACMAAGVTPRQAEVIVGIVTGDITPVITDGSWSQKKGSSS